MEEARLHFPACGLARAMEIVAFDRPISSEQALAWKLATKVVGDGQVLEEAWKMAVNWQAVRFILLAGANNFSLIHPHSLRDSN